MALHALIGGFWEGGDFWGRGSGVKIISYFGDMIIFFYLKTKN